MRLNQMLTVVVASSTAITLAAIVLDFTGVIDLSCNTEGCGVHLEKSSDSSWMRLGIDWALIHRDLTVTSTEANHIRSGLLHTLDGSSRKDCANAVSI